MDITKIKDMNRRCYVIAFRKQLAYAAKVLDMHASVPPYNPDLMFAKEMHYRYAEIRKRYARLLWGDATFPRGELAYRIMLDQ